MHMHVAGFVDIVSFFGRKKARREESKLCTYCLMEREKKIHRLLTIIDDTFVVVFFFFFVNLPRSINVDECLTRTESH